MKENTLQTAESWWNKYGKTTPESFTIQGLFEDLVAYANWLQQEEKLSLEDRKKAFIESVRPYVDEVGKDVATSFCRYWLQIAKNGRKFKFEKEATWDVKLRLKTWVRNQRNFTAAGILKNKYAREKED